MTNKIDVEQATFNPTRFFKSPSQVLNEPSLSQRDKIQILRTWKYDVILQERAEEENMPVTSAPDLLSEIEKALLALGAPSDSTY